MRLAREAGFESVAKVPTDGHPGVFATLDAGAPRTVGLYFMYDVKQVDPAEWSSPPFEAAIVDKPGLGKVVMGRGAVNQKGPEAALLAALHAIRGAGRKPPVNLVLVAEGEEEIGSPHFKQVVQRPEVAAALRRVHRRLHALRRPGPRRQRDRLPGGQGRGRAGAGGQRRQVGPRAEEGRPLQQPRAAGRARLPPGAGAGHAGHRRRRPRHRRASPTRPGPCPPRERAMLDVAAVRLQEATAKKLLSADRWVHDVGLARVARAPRVPAHGEHRGAGRRLHRAGRQDRAPAPRGGQAGPPPGAGHDVRRRGRRAARAPGQARLRRHRGQPQRRLRPHRHLRGRGAHPRADGRVQPRGPRPDPLAAQRRLLSRATSSPASR